MVGENETVKTVDAKPTGSGRGEAIDTKFDPQLVSTGSKVSPFWTAIDPTPARLPASRPVHQGSLT